MFRLGLIQMYVKPGDLPVNLRRAGRLIEEAAKGGAQVVVLPEAMDCGWTSPLARFWAARVPQGGTCQWLRDAAVDFGVYVCSGLTEREGDENDPRLEDEEFRAAATLYNAAVLISPAGELLLHHRKLNELDIAHDLYAQGDRLGVARTELATFGLMICADGFATGHVVSRAMGLMGADVILSPSAWAVPADHDNLKTPYGQEWRDCYVPVAREYGLWVVGVSNVGPITAGPWEGRRCIGCSLVIGPDGRAVLQGPYGEDAERVMFVDIEPHERRVRGSSWQGRDRATNS
jgi:predicted amidohydrolase